MRRGIAVVFVTALAASTLALAAGPVAAGPDDWGFLNVSYSVLDEGPYVSAGLHSQAVWDSYDPATDSFTSPQARVEQLGCDSSGRVDLLDPGGSRIATGRIRSPGVSLPPDIEPGTYFVRQRCLVDDVLQSACAELEVTAAGRAASREAVVGGPVISDPCPAAGPDDWGFTNISPGSGPPRTDIVAFVNSQEAWDSSEPATELYSDEYRANLAECLSNARGDLLNRFGVRIDTTDPLLTVPDGTEPGDYSIFVGCFAVGQLRSVCADFEVTAGTPSGPSGRQPEHPGPLIKDPCPISLLTVVGRSLLRGLSRFGDLGARIFAAAPPVSGPSLTTTTGPTEQTSGSAPPPGGRGGTPPPAGDTAGPTIGAVGVSRNPIAEAYNSESTCSVTGQPSVATVTASVSDPSGIGSVTMSWPGGSKSMSGSGTRSATIGPFPTSTTSTSTVVSITITATDGVGNVATRQGSVTVTDCTLG